MKPTKDDGSTLNAETFNGNFTAIPKDNSQVGADVDDLRAAEIDYGSMNEEDAKESGYTGANGEAVDMAKPDVEGRPTGALTDLGAGRSGVVERHGQLHQAVP